MPFVPELYRMAVEMSAPYGYQDSGVPLEKWDTHERTIANAAIAENHDGSQTEQSELSNEPLENQTVTPYNETKQRKGWRIWSFGYYPDSSVTASLQNFLIMRQNTVPAEWLRSGRMSLCHNLLTSWMILFRWGC